MNGIFEFYWFLLHHSSFMQLSKPIDYQFYSFWHSNLRPIFSCKLILGRDFRLITLEQIPARPEKTSFDSFMRAQPTKTNFPVCCSGWLRYSVPEYKKTGAYAGSC